MAMAVVPAAMMALDQAGISVSDVKAFKTHNPFVANDVHMAKEMGIDVMNFNNYGSPSSTVILRRLQQVGGLLN